MFPSRFLLVSFGAVTAIGMLCGAAPQSEASPITLVVPNANAMMAGNAPLIIGGPSPGVHFEEVFASNQFTGPMLITEAVLRSAPGFGALSASSPSFDVMLSTTSASPSTLSGTFSANIGSNQTTVYNAPLSVSDAGCAGPSPCPFDLFLPFSAPFLYDPSQGSLLLDYLEEPGLIAESGALDFQGFPGFTGPLAFLANQSLSATTGTLGPGGLVIEFVGTPVPEPATLTLTIMGLAGAAVTRYRRRRGNEITPGCPPV
jgi:hypothetical protein